MQRNVRQQSALLRILKATTTLPAQITLYASALGAIALIPGVDLPPALATIAGGVGVNVVSSILERVARGEAVSDEEIRQQVQTAIDDSNIAKLLTADEFQRTIAKLVRRQDHLKYAIQSGEYAIAERLAEQYAQYRSLITELHSDISSICDELQALSTRQQSEEIITLLQQVINLVEAGQVGKQITSQVETPLDKLSIVNPFYTGGRINDPELFCGRKRLLREIRAELKKRCSVSLVGESEIGKSSLLYYLYTTCTDWLPGVTIEHIDLQSVLDEADFCETVLDKLGERGDTLRDLKRVLQAREVILLLDEVERIAEPDFNPRLHDLLRSLAQEPHFAMCLATQDPLIKVFPARTPCGVSPFHNIFTVKTLGPFTEAEARAFLAARLANTSVVFANREIERLLAESQYHPARLQAGAKALFEEKIA